jgi:hypothetical protein
MMLTIKKIEINVDKDEVAYTLKPDCSLVKCLKRYSLSDKSLKVGDKVICTTYGNTYHIVNIRRA